MLKLVASIKHKIDVKVTEYEKNKSKTTEKVRKQTETEDLIKNLKKLSEILCPYVDPKSEFRDFHEWEHINEISFRTKEGKYYRSDIIKMTGLKTLRHIGGYDCDKWEASYKEYHSLFKSGNSNNAYSTKRALMAIHTTISNNKSDYANFSCKYVETIKNICDVINEYGIILIFEDSELFDSVFEVILSVIAEYESYTEAIKQYKKEKVLEKIKMEKAYINNLVKESTLMLEYNEK